MLRYGIPDYRLPPDVLDHDIDYILATGAEIRTGVCIGRDVQVADLQRGTMTRSMWPSAPTPTKSLAWKGEDSENVLSAVEFLRNCGEGHAPDFTGKRVGGHRRRATSAWTPPGPPSGWAPRASPASIAAGWTT